MSAPGDIIGVFFIMLELDLIRMSNNTYVLNILEKLNIIPTIFYTNRIDPKSVH